MATNYMHEEAERLTHSVAVSGTCCMYNDLTQLSSKQKALIMTSGTVITKDFKHFLFHSSKQIGVNLGSHSVT